jgi:hypothetical protein
MNSARDTRCRVGCPIRRSRDQRSLASPPGFSQRAASFIASQCQGIHQMPFIRARSQGTPVLRIIQGSPARPAVPRKTAAHRDKPHPLSTEGQPARGRSHEDTSSDGASHPVRTPQDNSPTGQQANAAARPPRSHSQIRFTLQSTPAPEPRPPARDMPARPPRNRNQTWSSPSIGRRDQQLGSHRAEPGPRFLRLLISARVEVNGIEPMTSCLQSRRSPN